MHYLNRGFSSLCLALFLTTCAANNRNQPFLSGQTNFTVELLTEQNVCDVSFQLSNLIQEHIILIEASLWLKNSEGELTQLDVWNGDDVLNLFSGDQILHANAVQNYNYDFAPHIVTTEPSYTLELQIIGLNNGLPSVGQILSFCSVP
ncbi:MAG TPA: hypothetical protein PKC21_05915 [Oligoflexia bacterium]|nr:hypothetical protein [Oligoflexia bacterium]HMR24870.1 hypothetical protein [Oligoflexia bacterium]